MARICPKCNHYSEDGSELTCPPCGVEMKFTLLPPPGQEAKPLEGVVAVSATAGNLARNAPSTSLTDQVFTWARDNPRLAGSAVAIVLLLVGLAIGTGTVGYQFRQIQVGMTIDEVERATRPYYGPRGRGQGAAHKLRFDRLARVGPAYYSLTDGRTRLDVEFFDGRVVRVSKQEQK